MKNLVKSITVLVLAATVMFACEKEEVNTNELDETTQTRGPVLDIDPIAYGPDLVVTKVTTTLPLVVGSACGGTKRQTSCGVNYVLTVEVTNIGNADVIGDYWIRMDKPTGASAQVDRMSPTSSLAVGAKHTFVIGPAPFGGCSGVAFSEQQLVLTADIFDDISETNESNNTARPYRYCGD